MRQKYDKSQHLSPTSLREKKLALPSHMHHNLHILMLSQTELPQNTATHAPQLDVSKVHCAEGLQEQEAQCGNQIYLWGKNIFIHLKSETQPLDFEEQ